MKNFQSKEFEGKDNRGKRKLTISKNILNGSPIYKETPISKRLTRLMTSYRDETTKPHFKQEYEKTLEKFPSVFRKCNGEFTAFASAAAIHKVA